MQLKLVMAYGGDLGWMIRSGSILKWHKAEGEEVRYGDDLFDMLVEEVVAHKAALAQNSQRLIYLPQTSVQRGRGGPLPQTLVNENLTVEEVDPAGPTVAMKRSFFVRIRSSDQGILRKVYAKEGQHRESGDVLALLTTAPDELVDDEASERLKQAGVFRVVANKIEQDSVVETNARQKTASGTNFIMARSEPETGSRIGIYCTPGLPLLPIFGAAPLIQRNLQGKCCIIEESWLDLRSDVLLDYVNAYPSEQVEELSNRWSKFGWWLQPQWLDKTFRVEDPSGEEEFPKTVVVLSIASDLEEACFRHKDYGMLVPSEAVYSFDAEGLEWFRRKFAPVGKLSGDDFLKSFGKLIQVIQRQTGAHVLVFNAFTSAPRGCDHNYEFLEDHPAIRRLEFNLALAELSRELEFSILDLDRILKKSGIAEQLDWDSPAPNVYPVIAGEAYRILRDRGLVC